jgi:hypothetical protein
MILSPQTVKVFFFFKKKRETIEKRTENSKVPTHQGCIQHIKIILVLDLQFADDIH